MGGAARPHPPSSAAIRHRGRSRGPGEERGLPGAARGEALVPDRLPLLVLWGVVHAGKSSPPCGAACGRWGLPGAGGGH